MLKKLGLITLSAVSAFAMHSAEISINDKDLELGARFDLGQFNSTVEPDTTYLGLKYINGTEENSDEENIDTNGYYEASFMMRREVQNSGVTFGIGVKTNYTKIEDEDFMTIPLGLELGYGVASQIPIYIGASVYYAPESLSLLDADGFLEYRVDISAEIIERGSVILGYRNLDLKFNTSDDTVNYNNSAYFGFRFAF